jgi:TRAP-type C4-dicarboxylate transport system permease small subunit
MDLALVILITLFIGIALGAVGVHYIHNVASAAHRALTVPSGSVASVPAPVTNILTDVQARIAALEAKLTTAAPKV